MMVCPADLSAFIDHDDDGSGSGGDNILHNIHHAYRTRSSSSNSLG